MSCSSCASVDIDFDDHFRIKVHKPSLTDIDEKLYHFTIILTDDSGYQHSTLVGVYIEIIVEDYYVNLDANCTARITSIDRYGDVNILFSHNMK